MQKGLIRKGLVLSVIVLFIGVGIQPALSVETKTSIVNKESEDCIECQPVNRVDLLRVKILLIRMEVYINIILSKLVHIPEIREKCQEILNIINLGIQSEFLDEFCQFLENLDDSLWELLYGINEMLYRIYELFPKLEYMLYIIQTLIIGVVEGLTFILQVLILLLCDWP